MSTQRPATRSIRDLEAAGCRILPLDVTDEDSMERAVAAGKVFDSKAGQLRNVILPVGMQAIVADVYRDTSWFDGKDCIVLDYSKTSIVAHWIRDEIRMVAPGLYLGLVFWGRERILDFALSNPKPIANAAG